MILSKVQAGQKITAQMFNNIIDAIRECQINSVVGSGGTVATFKRGPGGTTVSIKSKKTGQVSSQVCPFDVSGVASGSSLILTVQAGLVNGVMPLNNMVTLSTATAGKKYVVINCDTDGKNVTSASLSVVSSLPVPVSASADTAPVTFGVMISAISGTEIYKTIPCGNIIARVSPSIQTDASTYVAGKRNYTQYYNWLY